MILKSISQSLINLVYFSRASFSNPLLIPSYSFTRALEEAEKGNDNDALDYLSKEVSDNPNNGYAHMTLAALQADAGDYIDAMTSINLAIKKLPKKDTYFSGRAYAIRAKLYAFTGDTIKSLADFIKAVRINPDDEDVLEAFGQRLYEWKRYDNADVIYRRIISINPTNPVGYMGLGRDARAVGNYEEAIRQFDTVIRMYEDYSSGYASRAESYLRLGKYLESINDIVKSLKIDNNLKALHYLYKFPEEQVTLAVTKLKSMAVKNPHDYKWWLYIAELYKVTRHYHEALEAASKGFEIDAYYDFLELIAECYRNLGDYADALYYVNLALQMDQDNLDLISLKADILGKSGDIEQSIAEWSKYIERKPDAFDGYYHRGFLEDNSGDSDAALDDYNTAIMLKPDYARSYLGKGDTLMRKGQPEEALEAYRKVVELDTVPANNSCAMYALLALGENDKAIDFMKRVIENDSTFCNNYYDAACFYCRIGDLDESLANLRIAFEKGFRLFHHVKVDYDLEALRLTDGFKSLIDEFESKTKNETVPGSPELHELSERVEIPFTPDGGCILVKCSINGLPLNFIFDTGASIVSMSQLEATFMLKNSYLSSKDIVGNGQYMDANGDLSEGTVINLREVDFGGLKLKNVRASVVRNQKAPLLLGQSVLGRLGSIEIDNPGKKLIITHTK